MSRLLETVRPIARSYFDGRASPAHDWQHVRRVETNGRRLLSARAEVGDDADALVLGLATLLHDIGRPGEDAGEIDDHAEWGAMEARSVLESVHDDGEKNGTRATLSDATIDEIAHCIRAHRYSTEVEPRTLEAKLLSDADNLDALGAIGLSRVFSYGGERGTPLYDPDVPPAADDSTAGRSSVNHIAKKILDLPNRMYTDAGYREALERRATIEAFLDSLAQELECQELARLVADSPQPDDETREDR